MIETEMLERLHIALSYYARPRAYGTGSHSVFIDDTAVAAEALKGCGLERFGGKQ